MAGSGSGWQLVHLTSRPDGRGAELRAKVPFDFEDEEQRKGLRFQVQVTDQVSLEFLSEYKDSKRDHFLYHSWTYSTTMAS